VNDVRNTYFDPPRLADSVLYRGVRYKSEPVILLEWHVRGIPVHLRGQSV